MDFCFAAADLKAALAVVVPMLVVIGSRIRLFFGAIEDDSHHALFRNLLQQFVDDAVSGSSQLSQPEELHQRAIHQHVCVSKYSQRRCINDDVIKHPSNLRQDACIAWSRQ